MIDETPDDTGLAPDPGRVKRAAPTIDLEATEISSEPPKTEVKTDVKTEAETGPRRRQSQNLRPSGPPWQPRHRRRNGPRLPFLPG